MKKYFKYIAIILVVVIAIGGFAIKKKIDEENASSSNTIQFAEVIVSKGNIEISVSGDGNLTSSNRKEVRPDINGTIEEIHVSVGDYVEEGDLILTNEKDSSIYAPISGTIISLEVEEGDALNQNKNIAIISDLSDLEVVIQIDELDISKIKIGQDAILTSQAFPSEEYKGVVEGIAYEGSSNNGIATFDVTIKLDDIKDLRPGMTVNAEIVTESRENVLLLPIEAVQLRGNKNMVMMKSEESTENGMPNMVPVEIGLVSEDYVEIISGLNENDIVVYAKAIPQNANVNTPGGMGMNPFGGGNGGTKQRPAGFTRPQGGAN